LREPLEVLPLEFFENTVGEHLVGDCRDLFGVLPCGVERLQLDGESAALDVLVRCHLERQAVDSGQPVERRLLVASRSAVPPEGTAGEVQRETLGERSFQCIVAPATVAAPLAVDEDP